MKRLGVLSVLLLVFASTAAAPAQDAVAAWLEEAGLNRLLARRLESHIDATGDKNARAAIAQQLALTYESLLDAADSGRERDRIIERATFVLSKIDDDAGDPLRLALLRSSYTAAARECEAFRLALDGSDGLSATEAELITRLQQTSADLLEIRKRLDRREQSLERRINRTRGMSAQLLSARSDELGRSIAQATFYEGWTRAYLAWLAGDRDEALAAQQLFGKLLATGEAFPDSVDISMDLRDNPIFAESILGVAFAKTSTDSIATIRNWLDLLNVHGAAASVRDRLPYWRLAFYADAGGHKEALEVLRDFDREAPVDWLRLAAVAGLSAQQGSSAAQTLGTDAIARLAARGAFSHVIDLAERFSLDALDRRGFALHYVAGVRAFREAQDLKNEGDPQRARSSWRTAASSLAVAVSEPDADSFPEAIPGANAMQAWCFYELGEYAESANLFEQAAASDNIEAGNQLWMAISSLEKHAAEEGDTDELNARAGVLIDRFLDEHPSHPNAPAALLRRLATLKNPTLADAETLVSVASTSKTGARAHQEGVQMLYRIYRRAEDAADRIAAAERFLDVVAVPRFDPNQSSETHLHDLLRSRQLLEISLWEPIARPKIARDVLAALDSGVSLRVIDLSENERELDYRRIRLALAENEVGEALRILERLEADTSDDWSTLAATVLLKRASVVLLTEDDEISDRRRQHGVDAVRRCATLLLGENLDTVDLTKPKKAQMVRALALAEVFVFEASGATDVRERALDLMTRLLKVHPHDERILAAFSRTAASAGYTERALAALRTLLAGTAPNSDLFFERKVLLVELLMESNPDRARDVLRQHAALHANYGVEPWAAQLRAFARELGVFEDGVVKDTGEDTS